MKKCRHSKQAVQYSAGMLTKADRAWFKAHIADCTQCAAIVSADRELVNKVGASANAVNVPAGLDDRVLKRLSEEPSLTMVRPQHAGANTGTVAFVRRILPVSACFVLLMLGALGFEMFSGTGETAVASEYYYIVTRLDEAERTLLMNGDDAVYEVLADVEFEEE